MNRPTSLYLDAIRFLAAMVVFLSHTAEQRWSGGVLWQIIPWGSDAVVVFFVLSGFVIAYVVEERERSARIYAINRLARIYSVTIPALILTYVLDAFGRAEEPSLYLNSPDYVPNQVTWQILNSLLFTNRIWFNHVQPGTIGAYWSLGYEIPYYVAFGAAAFASRPWAIAGMIAVMATVGPNITAYFPMWLLGLASYRCCAKRPLAPTFGLMVWTVSIVLLALIELPPKNRPGLFYDVNILSPQWDRVLLHYYSVAMLFAMNIVGFRGASPLFAASFEMAARPIRWAGQNTFALYLFHMPIIQFIVAVGHQPPGSAINRSLVFVGAPSIIFILAEFTERRKESWKRLFSAILAQKLWLKAER